VRVGFSACGGPKRSYTFLCGIDIAGIKGLFGPSEMLTWSLLHRVRGLGISASVTTSSIATGHEAAALSSFRTLAICCMNNSAEVRRQYSLGAHSAG
jgi:hypothetical protein